ncbi:MAG: hypothetical protein RIC55_35695 [Pirellulaceae bacterium]
MHSTPRRLGIVRFLYTQNPFYLLSTGLVLYGLHVSFGAEGVGDFDRWALLASLCGYTLLTAVTAVLVIRLGKVWDDARSLLLILCLLFLAVSTCMDEFCNTQPELAPKLAGLGFLFSAAVSEGVLRFSPIRLPLLFRAPYYLILGLFFVYPLAVSPEITQLGEPPIRWRLLLFPALCGLAFLTLTPAARRGPRYASRSGAPWPWPLFPWSLFFFLALGVGLRSFLLCVSFDRNQGMDTIFGGYFLTPLLLALAVVVVEIMRRHDEPEMQGVVMLLAPLLLPLSARWSRIDSASDAFYHEVTGTYGSPLWLTLLALAAFYAYGMRRRAPLAETGLTFSLLALCFVGRETDGLQTLVAPQWLPLLALSGVQAALAARRRTTGRYLAASLSLAAAGYVLLRQTDYAELALPIVVHGVLLAILTIGATRSGELAGFLRTISSIGIAGLAIASVLWSGELWTNGDWLKELRPGLVASNSESLAAELQLIYLTGMALLALGYWRLTRERCALAAGGANLCLEYACQGWWLSGLLLERLGPRGFATLAAGTLCFLIAALISAAKGGLLAVLWRKTRRYWTTALATPSVRA